MNSLIILILFSTSAFANFIDLFDMTPEIQTFEQTPLPVDKMIVAYYCLENKGTADPKSTEIKYSESCKCDLGKSPIYYYEVWKKKYPDFKKSNLSIKDLEPTLTEIEFNKYKNPYAALIVMKESDRNCKFKKGADETIFRTCPDRNDGKEEDLTSEIQRTINDPTFNNKLASALYTAGEDFTKKRIDYLDSSVKAEPNSIQVDKNVVPGEPSSENKNNEVKVSPKEADLKNKSIATTENIVIDKSTVQKTVQTTDKVIPAETDCKELLKQEIASLLENDKKNIIGLQYELTVLKMAALATESKSRTTEALIKKQSNNISKIDNGIITKMNAMYKKHGLPEDAEAVTSHLKKKSASTSYYDKDKRFFNQDSSAFLLAYQNMNPNTGIKDADISVLWFMDKISQKAQTQSGKYSAAHNLTNLSTRVAQYTGAINPKEALSKAALDEMVSKQGTKLEDEFLELIEKFKATNTACFANLFAEGEDKCNINVVQDGFSELLAINSQIKSTDLVSIDINQNGGIDKTRFSISKYVDAPEKTRTKREIANKVQETTPKAEIVTDQKIVQPIPTIKKNNDLENLKIVYPD